MELTLVALVLFVILLAVMIFLYFKQRTQWQLLVSGYESLQQQHNELKVKYAILETTHKSQEQSSREKLEVLQNAKEELSVQFKNLANQIFEDKSKQFTHTHKEHFEMLLQPFREQITNFSLQSKEQFITESKERHLLKSELDRLKLMNEKLSQEAINLTNALKGENKTQGNWGEIVLQKILEQSGLREGIEYELQSTLKSNEGKVYRPDVIIHMPQNRDVIIDSKVSLVAYERYVSSDDVTLKKVALKEHIQSITSHIKGLSQKRYEKLEGVNSLDYVLLFMPIEGAFMLALQEDGAFFKSAYEDNILVVSPSTLLVTLRTIEHIWRTQRQEEHAMKIVQEAEAMYDKLVLFVEDMQSIGTSLAKTQTTYESAMKRLSTGRGNLLKRAENMKSLGIKPNKSISIESHEE
jgi:DNA recombination protein RmuC